MQTVLRSIPPPAVQRSRKLLTGTHDSAITQVVQRRRQRYRLPVTSPSTSSQLTMPVLPPATCWIGATRQQQERPDTGAERGRHGPGRRQRPLEPCPLVDGEIRLIAPFSPASRGQMADERALQRGLQQLDRRLSGIECSLGIAATKSIRVATGVVGADPQPPEPPFLRTPGVFLRTLGSYFSAGFAVTSPPASKDDRSRASLPMTWSGRFTCRPGR